MHNFALRQALQEVRHGWRHFAVFLACLMLGVAIMASVGTISSALRHALSDEAQSLLGGDAEVTVRGQPANAQQEQFLAQYGAVSKVTTLRAMLRAHDQSSLVELKGVDALYPLLGTLTFHETISREAVFADRGIAVDAILLTQLGLAIGDTVQLGTQNYQIRATIQTEPDKLVQIFSFGPRVMMSAEALAVSGLDGATSLVEHRYRIRVPTGMQVNDAFEAKLKDTLQISYPEMPWRVRTGTDGNSAVQRFIDQLLAFLTLCGLATFLIAGVGIGSSVRAYLERKSQTIAVLKVQGASRRTILFIFAWVLALLAVGGGAVGLLVAFALTSAALPFISQFLPVLAKQHAFDLSSSLLALWYGLLIAYLFSVPALLSAVNVKPSLLFRSKIASLPIRKDVTVRSAVAGLGVALFLTLFITIRDHLLIIGAGGIVLMAFLLFSTCGVMVRKLARRIPARRPWLRLALANLYRPGASTGTVIFAIGLSLMVLVALTLTEANVQSRITRVAEKEAPSLFLIDIQPHQKEALQALLSAYAEENSIMLHPMVRGRISGVNGKPVTEAEVDEEVRWALRGDRGLSYSAVPPQNARIEEGAWWPDDYRGPALLSVDQRFLDGMRLKLGDTLTVNILGEEITAKITNSRNIDYTTFQMNFSMMLSPGIIDDFPQTYLATVTLTDHARESEVVRRLGQEFPGVTAIRTAEAVELVQKVMHHIAIALRLAVGVSLIAGLLVLIGALGATIQQRRYDTAIFKMLGARQSDMLKACLAEWALLAVATSLIAVSLGTFAAWLISQRVRGQDFNAMPEVSLLTSTICVAVVLVTGYLGNRRLFKLRPSAMLRNE